MPCPTIRRLALRPCAGFGSWSKLSHHGATGEFAALVGGGCTAPVPSAARSRSRSRRGLFATPAPLVDADLDGVRDAKDRFRALQRLTGGRDGDLVDACDVCIAAADRCSATDAWHRQPLRSGLHNDGIVNLLTSHPEEALLYTDPLTDLDGDAA